jgi:hypothetical protein
MIEQAAVETTNGKGPEDRPGVAPSELLALPRQSTAGEEQGQGFVETLSETPPNRMPPNLIIRPPVTS